MMAAQTAPVMSFRFFIIHLNRLNSSPEPSGKALSGGLSHPLKAIGLLRLKPRLVGTPGASASVEDGIRATLTRGKYFTIKVLHQICDFSLFTTNSCDPIQQTQNFLNCNHKNRSTMLINAWS